MPRAKQPGTVQTQSDDVAAQVQANGTRPRRMPAAAEGKAEVAKRPSVKAAKSTKEAPKETADTKAQLTKQHAKPEHAPKTEHAPKAVHASAPKAEHASKPEHAPRAEHASRAENASKTEHAPKPAVAASRAKKAGAPAADEQRDLFFEHQRVLLTAERNNYTRQAEELRAQAEALALEHEPGDVQFDEEGGEGGTANVDRELDLHLSAQAQAAIEEIDAALAKIAEGTYGVCESCGNPVPKARLEALPHARLCVSCKSGGLSARRQ
jgi:DnaK suppressor protein